MKTNGYITITAAQNGYTCSADAGSTQITFSPNAQGERAFETWVLDALESLKAFRQVQRDHAALSRITRTSITVDASSDYAWNVMAKIGATRGES